MKYIDVDKLIAEIRQHIHDPKQIEDWRYRIKMEEDNALLERIINIAISLQQEQEQYVIGGQVFGATDIEQLYEGKVYIVSNLVQDTEFGLDVRDKVKMLLIKD